MTVLPKVLCLSAAILGLFLIYTLIVPSSHTCQHNIGCYLVPHALNHTAELQARIANSQLQLVPMVPQYKSIVADGPTFDKQVQTMARSFEKYVLQLSKQQQLRLQDRQIVLAIKEAENSYLECKAEIDATLNSSECLETWSHYEDCFYRVNQTQSHLELLLAKEQQTQSLISSEIRQPQVNPEDKPERAAQRVYNQSIHVNQAALQQLRTRLLEAEIKLTYSKQLKEKAEDRLETKDHTYKECWQNRRIYRQCEEISEQVKNLNLGTLKQLQQQLEAKKRLMEEMREMILRMGKGENRKMPEHWTEMYEAHVNEYKQMHKDFIHYNTQMERKACGCSEEEEKHFQLEVEREQEIIRDYQKELVQTNTIVIRLKRTLQEKEQERDSIIQEYQKALKEYETSAPELRESQLIKLKKKLEENRKSILNTELTFNKIDSECKQIKNKLGSSIKDLDQIEGCLGKRDYLFKLRAETAKYLEPERSLAKLLESKRALGEALAALEI